MKQYFKEDEWRIIEEGFSPEENRVAESILSLGNGHMGQRANFEEKYSGDSLQGSYMAGVYYPDKTRVGWWKNGYPEYFAKVLNSTNWIGINIDIAGEELDLANCKIQNFTRILNMKEGYLQRSFIAELSQGRKIKVDAIRFLSIVQKDIGAIKYSITPLNFNGSITFTPYLDGDVINEDSNYDEKFWEELSKTAYRNEASLTLRTKKLNFYMCTTMIYDIYQNGEALELDPVVTQKDKYVSSTVTVEVREGEETTLYKYVANNTSRDHEVDNLPIVNLNSISGCYEKGFEKLLEDQGRAWAYKWLESDIVIKGDVAAQQGIRFNIFQLNQTYTGEDARLNIGPKGFTGEKYGGSTYWDTEAYCLPFFLSTADEKISRNLLVYRLNHLEKAKENARKLGFSKGALYPMVTMNGEECHNEWEITFEEIHRNGAIAYAIYNYVNYTGDKAYLLPFGLKVLVEISRFWEERVNYVPSKDRYMILGVTGPNEYENNVSNNWYTNTMAAWTLEYTLESLRYAKETSPERYEEFVQELELLEEETEKWKSIIEKMYYPTEANLQIFLQQDGYMDKEQQLVKDLDPSQLPLNQNWSWDRILRSCFIKQADVLQGLFFLGDRFDLETKKRNFDFYELRTVHESSLSPCVHAILASELGYYDKAYEMYLRTSRLDLDNYNNDTEDGCHTTSMAGTWMSVVYGFGGMRVTNETLYLAPFIPEHWESYSFKISFRGVLLLVHITKDNIHISNESSSSLTFMLHNKSCTVEGGRTVVAPLG